jgi:hypothetical protein
MIDRDMRCARCGYNLRTTVSDGRCPECGLIVSDSIQPDSLDTAQRGWVAKQRAGVWLQFASYLLAAVAIIGEMYRSYLPGLTPAAMMVLRVAPLLGVAVAVWLLTTPRPDRHVKSSLRFVRYGFAAVLLLALVLPGVDHSSFKSTFGRAGWTLFFTLLVICWIGVGCVQVRIARTLNLPWLGMLLWAATIVWSIALAATAWFYVFRAFTERSPFDRAEPTYIFTLLIGGVLAVLSSFALAVAFSLRRENRPLS